MSATDRAFIRAFEQSAVSAPGSRSAPGDPADAPTAAAGHAHHHDAAAVVPPPPHMAPFGGGKDTRQPLSAFVSTPTIDDRFKPALQVEKLCWPGICDTLCHQVAKHLDGAARRLWAAGEEGRRVVAVGTCHRGEGGTTTLLCLARHLAALDGPVAMVDADFQQPDLAGRLDLAIAAGWEEVLRDRLPLVEAMVCSDREQLSLLPLRATKGQTNDLAGSLPASTSIRVLRQHYRHVLVDVGPLLDPDGAPSVLKLVERSGVDAALLVRDARTTSEEHLHSVVDALAKVGVPAIGMVNTFTAPVAA